MEWSASLSGVFHRASCLHPQISHVHPPSCISVLLYMGSVWRLPSHSLELSIVIEHLLSSRSASKYAFEIRVKCLCYPVSQTSVGVGLTCLATTLIQLILFLWQNSLLQHSWESVRSLSHSLSDCRSAIPVGTGAVCCVLGKGNSEENVKAAYTWFTGTWCCSSKKDKSSSVSTCH